MYTAYYLVITLPNSITEDADIEDIGDSFVEPVDGDAEVNGDTSVTEREAVDLS